MSTAEHTERGINNQPTATVNKSPDGEVLGATLFLGADDLAALGLNDADELVYQVNNGELRLTEVTNEQ